MYKLEISMKICIIGNREGWTYEEVRTKLLTYDIKSTDIIVSGGAKGVDSYAEMFAKEIGAETKIFLPNLRQTSPERYFKRNRDIIDYSDKIIAFDKKKVHSGTKYATDYARTQGKCCSLHYN